MKIIIYGLNITKIHLNFILCCFVCLFVLHSKIIPLSIIPLYIIFSNGLNLSAPLDLGFTQVKKEKKKNRKELVQFWANMNLTTLK